METAINLAKRILGYDIDNSSPYELLSWAPSCDPVSPVSNVDQCRGNYRRIAALIHPDKLKKSGFEHSTEAFQKLVRVFEAVSDPVVRLKFMKNNKSSKSGASIKSKVIESKKEGNSVNGQSKLKQIKDSSLSSSKVQKKPKAKSFVINDGNKSDLSECDSDVCFDDSSEDSADESGKVDDMGMKARQQRDNTNCYRTNVACPNCRDVWQPDDIRHYVLFMAFGVKVYCATCLFQFGPASAYHYCPLCKAQQISPGSSGADDVGGSGYDISMYDKQCTCNSCKKKYGYKSCLISESTLSMIRERLREEEAARKKKEERTRRAMQRSGDIVTSSSDQSVVIHGQGSANGGATDLWDPKVLDYNVGQVIVTGQCPLCSKSVRSAKNAQSHVEECMRHPPKIKATPFIVGEKRRGAPPKKAPSKKIINKPKTTGKKRERKGRPSSSSDDSEEYSSSDLE